MHLKRQSQVAHAADRRAATADRSVKAEAEEAEAEAAVERTEKLGHDIVT